MRKRIFVCMTILVLLLSLVGCGTTDGPMDNDAKNAPKNTVTEVVDDEAVNDEEKTAEPEVPEESVDTETAETEESDADGNESGSSLGAFKVAELNYDFEGVYWLTDYNAVVYFDGTNECVYFDFDYDGLVDEGKNEYTATERTFEYVGEGYAFAWYISDNRFTYWLDGGDMGGDDGATETTYTAITKEEAINLYSIIGADEEEEPAVTDTPEEEEPIVTETPETWANPEDVRVENLNFDFEGIYWKDDYASVEYFDGSKRITYTLGYYGETDISEMEYKADDNTFEFIMDGNVFRWWIADNRLEYCAYDPETGSDVGVVTYSQRAISKEQAIEFFPIIGEDVTEETAGDTEADRSFEGKYWSTGGTGHYYDGTTEYRYFTGDNELRTASYTVADGKIDSDRDGWSVVYRYSIKDGKLYLEPVFAEGEGGGGVTMVFEELTKDEFYSVFGITE